MIELINQLSPVEKEFLLKAPAYISLLAANEDGKMDLEEKDIVIREIHIKTYKSAPILQDFYREAEEVFQKNIDQLNAELPKAKNERKKAINRELAKLEYIYQKLGEDFSLAIHESLKSYYGHVLHAHWNIFASIAFPFPDILRPIHNSGL